MPVAAAPARPYVLDATDAPKPVARDQGGGGALPLAPPPSGPDGDTLAQSIVQRLSALGGPAADATTVMTSSWAAVSQTAPPLPVVQRDTTTAAPAVPTAPSTTDTTTSATSTATTTLPIGTSGKRPDDQELRNLSQWLYPFISHRLKGELREGRERAGLLTDSYRRW
jgi:hypothetical protein